MAVVLVYSTFIRRARDIETLIIEWRKQGNRVIALNFDAESDFTRFLASQGIETYSHVVMNPGSLRYTIRHAVKLIAFCWRHKIDVVFSHLDGPNFIAAISQYFVRAKVYVVRHNAEEAALYNYASNWTYRLTYMLARKIIVVSEHAKLYMNRHEGVPKEKIQHINLGYDFSLYPMPKPELVVDIRRLYSQKILMVTVCRLTTYKRPEISIRLAKEMILRGYDAGLLILGEGPMKLELENMITSEGLRNSVFLIGHVSNVMDYIAAADVVVHPSTSESSNVVVKEAGLLSKVAIVCSGVGDFEDYLNDGKNCYMVEAERFVEQAVKILTDPAFDITKEDIGANLRHTILNQFDISQVLPKYSLLIEGK
jgi:glycosyltransferase involved in cell wall biosynthesis